MQRNTSQDLNGKMLYHSSYFIYSYDSFTFNPRFSILFENLECDYMATTYIVR